jgi:S-adenosylmethionine:tRNA ribosyltransferase-isomerase
MTLRLQSDSQLLDVLDEVGVPPLPPYIKRKGPQPQDAVQHDREFYQTVYARSPGAVAAPTAGLHFDEDILAKLKSAGVDNVNVTLHVGMGTFKPVSSESVAEHIMEAERYEISSSTAERINKARRQGGRILAVGSTVLRTLETSMDESGQIMPGSGRTRIFIYPPYHIRSADYMLTNFHLPRSTLLMMISALAGTDLVKRAYQEAVREGYRFYSYGDCMLIL